MKPAGFQGSLSSRRITAPVALAFIVFAATATSTRAQDARDPNEGAIQTLMRDFLIFGMYADGFRQGLQISRERIRAMALELLHFNDEEEQAEFESLVMTAKADDGRYFERLFPETLRPNLLNFEGKVLVAAWPAGGGSGRRGLLLPPGLDSHDRGYRTAVADIHITEEGAARLAWERPDPYALMSASAKCADIRRRFRTASNSELRSLLEEEKAWMELLLNIARYARSNAIPLAEFYDEWIGMVQANYDKLQSISLEAFRTLGIQRCEDIMFEDIANETALNAAR